MSVPPEKVDQLLMKQGATFDDIIYVTREGRRTVMHLLDGRALYTYIPLKDVKTSLPENEFLHINKGAIVSQRHIVSIDHGEYTMIDGATLSGRVRTPGEHSNNQRMLTENKRKYSMREKDPMEIICRDIWKSPMQFSILQLSFDENGGLNLVYRFSNDANNRYIGREDIVGKSFFEVFPGADIRWLVTLANIATNGGSKTILTFNRIRNLHIVVRCFQPEEGYIATVAMELDDMDRL